MKQKLLDYAFLFLENIELEKNEDGSLVKVMPQDRYAKKDIFSLNKYGFGPFCRFKLKNKIASAGIYILQRGPEILYVGETNNLAKRYSSSGYGGISPKNCYKGGQETNCRINNLILQEIAKGQCLSLWFLEKNIDKKKRLAIEASLVDQLKPIWNK